MSKVNTEQILSEILSIDKNNSFLKYLVKRLRSKDYRGWHISQHNRYDRQDIEMILQEIHNVVGEYDFAIPPGDYKRDTSLPEKFQKYQTIVKQIHSKLNRVTINSLKKNFFPDLERMGFLIRKKNKSEKTSRAFFYGKLAPNAVKFLEAKDLFEKHKKFTDGIDKLFSNRISELCEMISLSAYAKYAISIYELMFIFSDYDQDVDKIELLDSYRSLGTRHRKKVINLVKKYAKPDNFEGDKTNRRDFHNWKNQTQQIMNLLKMTVYFKVVQNKFLRLNSTKIGFFPELKRSVTAKIDYFSFHQVKKREKFELHHIVPFSCAQNTAEAKLIDDYRNLIYIHRNKHKEVSQDRDKYVVLSITSDEAIFYDFKDKERMVVTKNGKDALYSKKPSIVEKMQQHNVELLNAIFRAYKK